MRHMQKSRRMLSLSNLAVECFKKESELLQYIKQLVIILFISILGELCNAVLPLPIPAAVYGLAIMLVLLITGVLRLHQIEKVGNLFLEFMPIIFVPIALQILPVWKAFQNVILPFLIISVIGTFLIIVITGRVTQFIVERKERELGE